VASGAPLNFLPAGSCWREFAHRQWPLIADAELLLMQVGIYRVQGWIANSFQGVKMLSAGY
jgi:hypothetical protein